MSGKHLYRHVYYNINDKGERLFTEQLDV
jgi:hypothetical protein